MKVFEDRRRSLRFEVPKQILLLVGEVSIARITHV